MVINNINPYSPNNNDPRVSPTSQPNVAPGQHSSDQGGGNASQSQYSSLEAQRQQMRGAPGTNQSNTSTNDPNNPQKVNNTTQSGGAQNQTNNGTGGGPSIGSIFIQMAKAILRQIGNFIKVGHFSESVHPIQMITKYLQGKTMVEIAQTLLEAGITEDVVEESPILKHEALDLQSKAAGAKGEFETAIQYWQEMQRQNVSAQKDTHEHFRRG